MQSGGFQNMKRMAQKRAILFFYIILWSNLDIQIISRNFATVVTVTVVAKQGSV